jgi:hypothetical protein
MILWILTPYHVPIWLVFHAFDTGNFSHIFTSKPCITSCFLQLLLLIFSNISHSQNPALDI